jgi:hypothetical protein
MIKYGELRRALSIYTHSDIHEDIPVDYYRRVIKASLRAKHNGVDWDVNHAASILLYLAFNDEHLQLSQLNVDGLKTLDRAEKFLEQKLSGELQKVVDALF